MATPVAVAPVEGGRARVGDTVHSPTPVTTTASSSGRPPPATLADRLLDAALEFTTTHDSWPTVVDSP
jgi:hypothetical protein